MCTPTQGVWQPAGCVSCELVCVCVSLVREGPRTGGPGRRHDRPDAALRTRKQDTEGIPELKTGY